MHILMMQFYSNAPAPDFHEMAVALRSWGHTVWVATPNAIGDLEWQDGEHTVAIQPGPARLPQSILRFHLLAKIATRLVNVWFMLRVRAFVRESGAEIVQVNPREYACVITMFMPDRMRFVLDVRQPGEVAGDDLIGRLQNWKSRMRLRVNASVFYDHACFATEAAAHRILGNRWSRWATVHRVGQDPSFLAYHWNDKDERKGPAPVSFIYVGTLSKVRRLEHVFSALKWLLSKTTDFHVDFVGPDEACGYYQTLIGQMGVGPVVTIKPPVPYREVPKLIAAYDVALAYVPPLPDWRYQPTLKVLEYRALGVPAIASDNEPNREVIQDGVNGLLIEDLVESLGEAMLRFIMDRDFLWRCKTNARSMRQGRTWSDSAKLYEQAVYMRGRTDSADERQF